MSTLPPSGLAPTLPPAPHERARRAVRFSIVALGLLVTALVALRVSQGHASHLLAYNNDALATALVARLAFGVSLLAIIAAVVDIGATWRRERGAAASAAIIASIWALSVGWLLLRSTS